MASNGATRIRSAAKADQRCRKEDDSTALDAPWIAAAIPLVEAAARDAMESVSQNTGQGLREEERSERGGDSRHAKHCQEHEAVAKGAHSTLLIQTARVDTLDGGDEQGDRQRGDVAERDEARFGRRPHGRALVLQDEGHL